MTKQQATNMTPLTAEELCFFKQYGYLLKSKAVAKSACELALDRMWANAPERTEGRHFGCDDSF